MAWFKKETLEEQLVYKEAKSEALTKVMKSLEDFPSNYIDEIVELQAEIAVLKLRIKKEDVQFINKIK